MVVEIAVMAVTVTTVGTVETEILLVAALVPRGLVTVVVQLQEVQLLPRSKTNHSSQLWEASKRALSGSEGRLSGIDMQDHLRRSCMKAKLQGCAEGVFCQYIGMLLASSRKLFWVRTSPVFFSIFFFSTYQFVILVYSLMCS